MEYDQQCTRNKGLKSTIGKIIKGTLSQAPMKIRVSSIPSKHQNIIYHAPSRHAFGNSQTRFGYQQLKDDFVTPGPGQYIVGNSRIGGESMNLTSSKVSFSGFNNNINKEQQRFSVTKKQIGETTVSNSKKGTGSFASQTENKRFDLQKNPYPAPGAYQTKTSLKIGKKSKVKSTLMSNSQFSPQKTVDNLLAGPSKNQNPLFKKAHDLFRQQIIQSSKIPGPGQYSQYNSISSNQNILSSSKGFNSKLNNQYLLQAKINRSISTGNLPFKSKVQRFKVKQAQVPPVGLYNCDWKTQKPQTIKFSFPKKVPQQKKEEYIQKVISSVNNVNGNNQNGQKNLINVQDPNKRGDHNNQGTNNNPGPGSYQGYKSFTSHNQKSFKMKQSIYDRFGQLKHVYKIAKDQTSYNTPKPNSNQFNQIINNNILGNLNRKGSTSMFKSKVGRMKFEQNLMDPTQYKIEENFSKKSHLINFNKKWV